MTALDGKVLARQEADELCFLVIGKVTCHHSPALRQFAEEGLARGATRIQVDLRDCTYADSTILGTLLQLKRRCDGENGDAFRLVCPSVQFRQILTQIGAERLFRIVDQVTSGDMQTTWQQLNDNVVREGSSRFKQNVVQAHQELAKAGGVLGQRFGPLAEAMSRELEVQQGNRTERGRSEHQ
jgi:anti-anti-sigma factor